MKIISYILFVYFSLFYFAGSYNLKSLCTHFCDKIEYTEKDLKKELDQEEKEDEEFKDKQLLCEQSSNSHRDYHSSGIRHVMKSDEVDCKHISNIFIPPPESNI